MSLTVNLLGRDMRPIILPPIFLPALINTTAPSFIAFGRIFRDFIAAHFFIVI